MIDRFMPSYSLRQLDRRAVDASPARAYAAFRATDMYQLRFVRMLFGIRTFPERLLGRLRGKPIPPVHSSRIDDIARTGTGFIVLGETPGEEVVVGSVGKFWQPNIAFASVTPDSFPGFDRPGFGKLAWSLRVDPRDGGGSWLTIDLRVGATDATSLVRFSRYWWIIGRFSHAVRYGVLRMLIRELGGVSEDSAPLAGDEFLTAPRVQRTLAVTIEAPPDRVWPWLVQMGCRRAGWYSFDLLDNGGVHSAEAIIPELQQLKVGDILPARPKGPDGFAVLRMDPGRALVLGPPSLLPGGGPRWNTLWDSTWAFTLEPIGSAATRLKVRVRGSYQPSAKMAVIRPVITAVHELMQRRQIHNLRLRAEGQPV